MADNEINAVEIQIEDPLDFLSASEKKAYIRAHQDTLLRSEEEIRRVREAAGIPEEDDDGAYDPDEEDFYDGDDEAYEDEDDEPYEDDAYDGEGEPVRKEKKPYVYRDTRLYTDRKEKAAPAKKAAPKGKPRTSGKGGDDEPVEETVVDFMLSTGTKAMFAAIIILVLIIVYMIFVRPAIRRVTGLQGQNESALAQQEERQQAQEQETPPAPAQQEGQGGSEPAAPPAEEGERVVTTTALNLRTAPSAENSEVITTVPEGEVLTRISEEGQWSKVLFKGQEVYCASEYLRKE